MSVDKFYFQKEFLEIGDNGANGSYTAIRKKIENFARCYPKTSVVQKYGKNSDPTLVNFPT